VVIQQRWKQHQQQLRLREREMAAQRISYASPQMPSSTSPSVRFEGYSSNANNSSGNDSVSLHNVGGGADDFVDALHSPKEKWQACVNEYRQLLAEREALLDRNLSYQQILSRHYAEQRRRNGEEEATQLTNPEAEGAYWSLVRQVAEERQRVAGRSAALQRDLERQRQRYNPVMQEAAEQEHNFQQYIQELAANVRFMRSNRPIPSKTISEYIERESKERAAIHASRVRYLQLKNRLQRLRRAAKGHGNGSGGTAVASTTIAPPGSSSAPSHGSAEGEPNAADHHMFLIDFEQLKVENTNLNEKIEERSEEVLKLRSKVTNTIHIATHVREKLDCVRKENAELRQTVASTDEELSKARDQLARSKRRRDAHLRANTRIKERTPLVGSRDLLLDYERRKGVIREYRTRLVQLTDRHKELMDTIRQQEATVVTLQHELSHYPQ
jgi:chromosome segregation ATPase